MLMTVKAVKVQQKIHKLPRRRFCQNCVKTKMKQKQIITDQMNTKYKIEHKKLGMLMLMRAFNKNIMTKLI